MDVIVPIMVQLIAGGAGGNVIGQIVRSLNLGAAGNTVVGAIGGVVGIWLTGLVPGVDTLIGTTGGAGGLDAGALAGQGAAALIGGGVLTALVARIKSSMAKA